MKKLIKFDDGNALFSNAIDTQNYKELEVYKMLHSLLNIFVPIRTERERERKIVLQSIRT